IPRNSARMKPAAPMIGGMIWPMVEEEASTPAAKWLGYPVRFMSGMVKEPVVTVLATELPEIMPKKALDTTAALAGPPLVQPVSANDTSVKNCPAPVLRSRAP